MGILSDALERRQQPATLVNGFPLLSSRSAAGVSVTPDKSLQLSAVYACVQVLASSVAQLPLIIYERDGEAKQRAMLHPLYSLLHDSPNPEQTSFEFREMLMGHLCLRGNAFAEIEWSSSGQVVGLWPLHPDRVRVERDRESGELLYHVTTPGYKTVTLLQYQVWHLRGFGTDGVMGLSPIALQKQAVGLGLAAEEFGARFFGNDARPGGILQHPGELSDGAYDRLREGWLARHGGLDKAHRTAILEEGMTYQQIGIAPNEAQFLETRKFQVTDIARIFRVPPHMIADLDNATFSNIEHQGISFVVHTLTPWLVRFEQSIALNMMTPAERARYFAEFLVNGLLRGDISSRYQAYATGRQNGWLSANDIRRLENMNPVADGDTYLVPLNMMPAGAVGSEPQTPDAERQRLTPTEQRDIAAGISAEKRASAAARRRIQQAQRPIYEDTFARILRRERNDILAQYRKLGVGDAFDAWLLEFFEEHKAFVQRNLAPLNAAMLPLIVAAAADEVGEDEPELDNWLDAYTEAAATRQAARSQARIGQLDADAFEDALGEWENRAPFLARDESVRMANAATVVAFAAVGVQRKVWVSFNPSCPYCEGLSGRTVGIDKWFIPADAEFSPDGATISLKPSRDIGHAPAHGGCDCMIAAA